MCLGQLKKPYSLYLDITLDKSEKAHVLAIEAKGISYNLYPCEDTFYDENLRQTRARN